MERQTAVEIGRKAIDRVRNERFHQVAEKGYDYDHDDEHRMEEIASAAAYYLMPAWVNQDVCTSSADGGLLVKPLLALIADSAWGGLTRDDATTLLIATEADSQALDQRIDMVTKGAALALAELERLMRMREQETSL